MNCEICNKDILDNSQYINGKYYHNDCIEQLQKENALLKDNWKELEKFICYEQDRLLKATSHTYQDSFDKIKLVNSDIFEELKKVENKMKELFKEN